MQQPLLPPRQHLAAPGKWPTVGERMPGEGDPIWSLRFQGLVEKPYELTLVALQSLLHVERSIDIHCVTRWSKLGVRFSGVSLAGLIAQAEPLPSARYVSFTARSDRGHSTSLPLSDVLALDPLVTLAIDGQPLEPWRGGPLRLVVPGRYFYKSLKWLEQIELLDADRLGYWERTAGYHNTGDVWREERYMAGGVSKAEVQTILATRNIADRELRSLDVQGHDLDGFIATRSLLRDADFGRCSLREARFDFANLSNARFVGADLRNASFRGADVEGAEFSGADLRGASFAGASLFGATFQDSTPAGGAGRGAFVDGRTEFDEPGLAALAPDEYSYLQAALLQARPS